MSPAISKRMQDKNFTPQRLRQKPRPGNSVAEKSPEIALQWHPTKNNGLTPWEFSNGSDKDVWWLCRCGHEWIARIGHRTNPKFKTAGCSPCSSRAAGQNIIVGENDLGTTHPLLSQEWDYENNILTPQDFTAKSKYRVNWICKCGIKWKARIQQRTRGALGCESCAQSTAALRYHKRKIELGIIKSVAEEHPNLSKRWHEDNEVLPQDISSGSHREIDFYCLNDRQHTYKTKLRQEVRFPGAACPDCPRRNGITEGRYMNALSEILDTPVINTKINFVQEWRKVSQIQIDGLTEYKGQKIIVEYDGYAWHSIKEKFEKDILNTQGLLEMGYFVIRIREQCKSKVLPFLPIKADNLYQVNAKYTNKYYESRTIDICKLIKEWLDSQLF